MMWNESVETRICGEQDKSIVLLNADSTDSQTFPGEFADVTITSPPYNVGIDYGLHNDTMDYGTYVSEWSRKWLSNVYAWTKPGGRLILNLPVDTSGRIIGANQKPQTVRHPVASDVLHVAQQVGWMFRQWISWGENNISSGHAYGSKWMPTAPNIICADEAILVLYKGEWRRSKNNRTWDLTKEEHQKWYFGRWEFPGQPRSRIGHPAPFPPELPARCIKLYSFLEDVVFDPFCGSSTTLITAAKLSRKAVGVELNPDYCELARQRIFKETEIAVALYRKDSNGLTLLGGAQ